MDTFLEMEDFVDNLPRTSCRKKPSEVFCSICLRLNPGVAEPCPTRQLEPKRPVKRQPRTEAPGLVEFTSARPPVSRQEPKEEIVEAIPVAVEYIEPEPETTATFPIRREIHPERPTARPRPSPARRSVQQQPMAEFKRAHVPMPTPKPKPKATLKPVFKPMPEFQPVAQPEPVVKPVEDEEIMFQCPKCETMVSEGATTCPTCKVTFITEEETVQEPEPEPKPEAIFERRSKPTPVAAAKPAARPSPKSDPKPRAFTIPKRKGATSTKVNDIIADLDHIMEEDADLEVPKPRPRPQLRSVGKKPKPLPVIKKNKELQKAPAPVPKPKPEPVQTQEPEAIKDPIQTKPSDKEITDITKVSRSLLGRKKGNIKESIDTEEPEGSSFRQAGKLVDTSSRQGSDLDKHDAKAKKAPKPKPVDESSVFSRYIPKPKFGQDESSDSSSHRHGRDRDEPKPEPVKEQPKPRKSLKPLRKHEKAEKPHLITGPNIEESDDSSRRHGRARDEPKPEPETTPEPSLEEIQKKKLLANQLKGEVSSTQQLVKKAHGLGIDISESKLALKEALVAGRNEKYEEAIKLLQGTSLDIKTLMKEAEAASAAEPPAAHVTPSVHKPKRRALKKRGKPSEPLRMIPADKPALSSATEKRQGREVAGSYRPLTHQDHGKEAWDKKIKTKSKDKLVPIKPKRRRAMKKK
jgi:uncharacterized Zn finger protein (UPF0148 family)